MRRPSVACLLLNILLAANTTATVAAERRDRRILADVPTLAPFQHVKFCIAYPDDCAIDATQRSRIALTSDLRNTLARVNGEVNAAIVPVVKDYRHDVREGWAIAPTMGDCNDYAVTKRHRLIELGLPAAALRLSVVKTPDDVGHLILVVVTNEDELVLDNLTPEIRSWRQTNYNWLKIQSPTDPRFWLDIKSRRNASRHAKLTTDHLASM